jgi:RNA polymerase sigma factor (TIGR02999 family)
MAATPEGAGAVTRLLHEWQAGDREALDRLMPLVYDELRRIAAALMRSERRNHTLQATALAHEAYARLAGSDASATDRAHFLSLAARVMRRVLVAHARARRRLKRNAGLNVTLDERDAAIPASAERVIEIDQALDRLESLDVRKLKVLEMRLFGGLTHTEIADVLDVSVPTVERDYRTARAWLRAELESTPPAA